MPNRTTEDFYLLKEFEEINNYLRTFFSVGVTWYTFFITGNIVAGSLAFSKVPEGQSISPIYILPMSFIFIFVNVLAVVACLLSIKYVREREGRLETITEILSKPDKNNVMTSPFSLPLFIGLVKLVIGSLMGVIVGWVVLVVKLLT